MDEIKKKNLGTETAAENGQKEGFISSNTHCLATFPHPGVLGRENVTQTYMAHLETSFCVSVIHFYFLLLTMTFRPVLKSLCPDGRPPRATRCSGSAGGLIEAGIPS